MFTLFCKVLSPSVINLAQYLFSLMLWYYTGWANPAPVIQKHCLSEPCSGGKNSRRIRQTLVHQKMTISKKYVVQWHMLRISVKGPPIPSIIQMSYIFLESSKYEFANFLVNNFSTALHVTMALCIQQYESIKYRRYCKYHWLRMSGYDCWNKVSP